MEGERAFFDLRYWHYLVVADELDLVVQLGLEVLEGHAEMDCLIETLLAAWTYDAKQPAAAVAVAVDIVELVRVVAFAAADGAGAADVVEN